MDRAALRAVQTPQGFRRDVLERPRTPPAGRRRPTTPVWSRRCGGTVTTVPGSEEAFKVTRPLDLLLAEAVLRERG